MGKEKKEKKAVNESQNEGETDEMSYEDRLKYVSVISKPMAPKKLTKKVINCWSVKIQIWKIYIKKCCNNREATLV